MFEQLQKEHKWRYIVYKINMTSLLIDPIIFGDKDASYQQVTDTFIGSLLYFTPYCKDEGGGGVCSEIIYTEGAQLVYAWLSIKLFLTSGGIGAVGGGGG